MTPAELATIEALANAATPVPWRVDHSGDVVYDEPCVGVVGVAENLNEDDSAFIAAARSAIPELIAALRDVAARHVRVHDEADKYQTRALDAEAEVKRLREAEASWAKVYETHTNRLRATIRGMSTNEGKLHAQIAELEIALASK